MKNGCNNRPRPTSSTSYVAQAGWSDIFRDGFGNPHRMPISVEIKAAFGTTACQYDASATDPGCAGCQHRRAA